MSAVSEDYLAYIRETLEIMATMDEAQMKEDAFDCGSLCKVVNLTLGKSKKRHGHF